MYYHTIEFACCFGALYLSRMHSHRNIPFDHMARFNQLTKKLVSSLAACLARELTTEGGIASLHEASTGNLAFQIEPPMGRRMYCV